MNKLSKGQFLAPHWFFHLHFSGSVKNQIDQRNLELISIEFFELFLTILTNQISKSNHMNLNIRGQITQERDQLNAELKIEQ